jgi:RNA polymerase sigma-54 factor
MALTQRLELKQGQTLVMTPQLQQAIKLLQLSNLELADYVEAELEKNPLLEREELNAGEVEPTPRELEGAAAIADDAPLDKTLATEDFGTASDLDAGHDDLYADESRAEKQPPGEANQPLTDWSHTGPGGHADGEDFEGTLTAETTLKGHLEAQLAIAALQPHQRFIAEVLIESVDEAGYLRADLIEVAERLGTTREDCEATLSVLQGFDPAGVFARDLVECLALQLKERDRLDLRSLHAVLPRCFRHHRHDRGNPRADSETRAGAGLRAGAAGGARRLCARRLGWHLARGIELGHLAPRFG